MVRMRLTCSALLLAFPGHGARQYFSSSLDRVLAIGNAGTWKAGVALFVDLDLSAAPPTYLRSDSRTVNWNASGSGNLK
jgi:hypothetical protein